MLFEVDALKRQIHSRVFHTHKIGNNANIGIKGFTIDMCK